MLTLPLKYASDGSVSLQEMIDAYWATGEPPVSRRCESGACPGQYATHTNRIPDHGLPPYLIIQIKRFDRLGNKQFKICDVVQGNQSIRFRSTQYTLKDAAVHKEKHPAHYRAYSVHRCASLHSTGVKSVTGEFDMEWTPYFLFFEKVVLPPFE